MNQLRNLDLPEPPRHHHHKHALDREALIIKEAIEEAQKEGVGYVAVKEVSPEIKQTLREKGFDLHKEESNQLDLKEIPKAEMYVVIDWQGHK